MGAGNSPDAHFRQSVALLKGTKWSNSAWRIKPVLGRILGLFSITLGSFKLGESPQGLLRLDGVTELWQRSPFCANGQISQTVAPRLG
jgi:hypothetical protein